MDLGSGDGRNIIAAAKRGARALGVEYDRELVAAVAAQRGRGRRRRHARASSRATCSRPTSRRPRCSRSSCCPTTCSGSSRSSALKPGTRIVTNGFPIDGWAAKETGTADGDCGSWCTAYLYIVGESTPK